MIRKILITLFILTYALTSWSTGFDSLKAKADSAYSKENYTDALKLYLELSKKGESSAICYDLGCTYYRMDNMAKSVLWFERAAKLDPSDEDIRFNLDMARSKTIDKITPKHEMFFISMWRDLMHSLSVTQWSVAALSLFFLALVMLCLYLFTYNVIIRKVGFFGAIALFIGTLLANTLAYSLRLYNNNNLFGIVMVPALNVRSTPTESGTDLFVIHEGTRVEIVDSSMKDWVEVEIADGKKGWVERSGFESI